MVRSSQKIRPAAKVFAAAAHKNGEKETGLPADDSRTTAHAGDIVLYNGNNKFTAVVQESNLKTRKAAEKNFCRLL